MQTARVHNGSPPRAQACIWITPRTASLRGPWSCCSRSPRPATSIFFFFQAEDGIRDRNVTGVQTCALPISAQEDGPDRPRGRQEDTLEAAREVDLMVVVGGRSSANTKELTRLCGIAGTKAEIGRASCRERV